MSTLLRLLLVEDNADDAQLLVHELRRNSYELEFERVETADAMRTALAEKTWDLIISDYSLPHFSAPEALQVLKSSALDLPFIIVSGTIGEEAAVTALKAGAHDFLIKSKYTRLTHVIQRELNEAESRRERKRAEIALHESEARLRQVWESTSDAMTLSDEHGIVISANPACFHLYGYSPEEIIGKSFAFTLPEESREQIMEQYKTMFTSDFTPPSFETIVRRADGVERITESNITFLADDSGRRMAMLATVHDITERRQAEEIIRKYAGELEEKVKQRTAELDRTNVELEHANRVKDEFLANMSHELRTPLNSILGLSESLLEQRRGPLNDSQQKSLQIIESSGHHLLELINDILDLSKIEAGKFDYYPQVVSINELCRSSLSFVKDQAGRKSINLHYNNEASISSIFADPRRLKQILVNLLTNAVKFTPENGQVTVDVRADLEKELIQISVIDTGIGIAAEDLKRLFTPFVQLDSSLNRQFEGTGLGLALAQKLTDLHGGSLAVESEIGKGSRFTLNLRYILDFTEQSPKITTDKKHPTVDLRSEGIDLPTNGSPTHHKILIVEDNEANIITIGEYLQSYGYDIAVAHDGLEAIEKAKQTSPDLILMDIQMPNMNGLEAMRNLRADTRFASTPIIALTALAMVGDRERCLEAGASEYLSKPVSLKGLKQLIKTFLAR